jgi:hypothetical protein
MKKYISMLSLMALATFSSFARELPDPPEGFVWKDFSEVKISCLCPEGWNYKTFAHGDAMTCQISPEKIQDGKGLDIGMTINVIKNVTEKSKVSAERYAAHHLANYVPKEDFITFSEPQDHGKLQIRIAEVIRKTDDMHILLRTYANKDTDTLFIVTFGTPTEKWEEYLPYHIIFKYMILDDEI